MGGGRYTIFLPRKKRIKDTFLFEKTVNINTYSRQKFIKKGLILLTCNCKTLYQVKTYPPASQVSREVANLTERKNLQTHVYGVKECVTLSVCL